jgi:transposase
MWTQHTQVRFDGQDVYVGLDNAKRSWKVAIYLGDMFFQAFTQTPSPEALMHYLRHHFPGARYHIVYEAGYFGFWIQRAFSQLGAECSVTNPADVPTTNKERRGKNDRIDANKLGRSYAHGELHTIYVPDLAREEDRTLVRTRMRFVRKQTRTKCQIKALLCQFGYHLPEDMTDRYWSRAYISWLQGLTLTRASGTMAKDVLIQELLSLRKTIATMTLSIRHLAQEDPYRCPYDLLRTIGGIGPLAAMTLLTEIIDIARFKNLDRLCSFVGLIPDEKSTGDREYHTGITKRRNPVLRFILIECAWMAIRSDPALAEAFQRYCTRMPSHQAIVRIARKLLNRIRFVLKNQAPYVSGVAA